MKYIFLILNLNISIAGIEKLKSTNPVIVKYQDIATKEYEENQSLHSKETKMRYQSIGLLNKLSNNINSENDINETLFRSNMVNKHITNDTQQVIVLLYACACLDILIQGNSAYKINNRIWSIGKIIPEIERCINVFNYINDDKIKQDFYMSISLVIIELVLKNIESAKTSMLHQLEKSPTEIIERLVLLNKYLKSLSIDRLLASCELAQTMTKQLEANAIKLQDDLNTLDNSNLKLFKAIEDIKITVFTLIKY